MHVVANVLRVDLSDIHESADVPLGSRKQRNQPLLAVCRAASVQENLLFRFHFVGFLEGKSWKQADLLLFVNSGWR